MEIGLQVEGKALPRPVQRDGAHRQQNHHCQQAYHHDLVDLFYAVAQTSGTNQHTSQHHYDHKQRHQARLAHELAELASHSIGVQTDEVALGHFDAVKHQPAGHRGVEHHQQVVARDAEPAVPVPLASLGFQRLEGLGDPPLASPAHRELHDHHRQAKNQQKQQVDQHKGRPTVLPCDVREAPHVSQADGTSRGDEHEAQA